MGVRPAFAVGACGRAFVSSSILPSVSRARAFRNFIRKSSRCESEGGPNFAATTIVCPVDASVRRADGIAAFARAGSAPAWWEGAGVPQGFAQSTRSVLHWWSLLPGNVRGAVWITLAAVLTACNGAIIKSLQDLHVLQLIFLRALIGLVVLMPFVLRTGIGAVRSRRPEMHFLRVGLTLGGMGCYFYAMQKIPLANAVSLQFTKPLFQIILAIWFLSEVIRWRRGVATLAGFLGALLIVRPGTDQFDFGTLYALAGALLFAGSQTCIKRLSTTDSPVTITLYFSLLGAPAMLLPALWLWQPPTGEQWLLILAFGVLSTCGQTMWAYGIRAGEVTFVGPFDYTQLLWAGLLGFFFFAEVPDAWSIAGALVIVVSTLYMAHREAALGRARRAAAGGP